MAITIAMTSGTAALIQVAVSTANMVKAILLDALGTLIGFENPAPHLQSALQRRGYPVSLEEAERAIRAEITYYRAHLHEGRDAESLHDLRVRSARALGLDVPDEVALDALLAALRFFAYPDSAPTLLALRERGIRLVVVSNWDWSLHERLAETGLTPLIDGALASAEVGSAKPDGAIFRAALQLTGTAPEQTWHVGDTPAADVEGARAAGIRPVLIAREGERPAGAVRSLAELIPLAGT
ncbi:HAD-IA family hydrolase [Solirubrobacter taibaiensis]|nr:HAD-IA family hydrolase [Solirubrobacter taibaiensis]